ncbi:MAG: hypothetical protein HUJ65_06290 [Oscillospiraceae bacterium]|nr:hypothetical protein [Oscillospiraceae bacterium]
MDITSFSAKDRLTPLFDGESFSHAYIISGPPGSGANELADTLAAAAVCSGTGKRPCMQCRHCRKTSNGSHPDITVVDFIDNKHLITVEQIREVRTDAIVMPNEADRKVYIIRHADTMNLNGQNALLKILEEPPSYAMFILVAENPINLLPTVRSRCALITLSPPGVEIEPEIRELAERLFSAMEKGEKALTEFSFTLSKLERRDIGNFITASKYVCTERMADLIRGRGGKLTLKALSEAEAVLARFAEFFKFNVGTVHISGYLCAALNGVDKKE